MTPKTPSSLETLRKAKKFCPAGKLEDFAQHSAPDRIYRDRPVELHDFEWELMPATDTLPQPRWNPRNQAMCWAWSFRCKRCGKQDRYFEPVDSAVLV